MGRVLIVGAGFSGAVLARELADNWKLHSTVIDQRGHVGGNCHTERDPATGILLHTFGPHIFHTSRQDVWDYVTRFTRFSNFVLRPKASIPKGVFGLPINLHTINQFFGKRFRSIVTNATAGQRQIIRGEATVVDQGCRANIPRIACEIADRKKCLRTNNPPDWII
jgi:UDP-galactopyranose mutase